MSKGAETRQHILGGALRLASQVGLNGLTIGGLAKEMSLSKSGLFAHFRSKEALQIQTLELAGELFIEKVIRPAVQMARGEPRVRTLFERWLHWANMEQMPGGCVMVAAAIELDDQPGPARDRLVKLQKDFLATRARIVQTAIDAGHFRADLDPEQFAVDLFGIFLAYGHSHRLLRDPKAEKRARAAFEALIAAARPTSSKKT